MLLVFLEFPVKQERLNERFGTDEGNGVEGRGSRQDFNVVLHELFAEFPKDPAGGRIRFTDAMRQKNFHMQRAR